MAAKKEEQVVEDGGKRKREEGTVEGAEEEENRKSGKGGQRNHCPECKKTFERLSNLNAHKRLHTGETPYKCKEKNCDKSFKWKSSLSSHMRSHEKSAPPKIVQTGEVKQEGVMGGAPQGAYVMKGANDQAGNPMNLVSWKPENGNEQGEDPNSAEAKAKVANAVYAPHPEYAIQAMPFAGFGPRIQPTHFHAQMVQGKQAIAVHGAEGEQNGAVAQPGIPHQNIIAGTAPDGSFVPIAYQPVIQLTPGMPFLAPWPAQMPQAGPGGTKLIYSAAPQQFQDMSKLGKQPGGPEKGGVSKIRPAPQHRPGQIPIRQQPMLKKRESFPASKKVNLAPAVSPNEGTTEAGKKRSQNASNIKPAATTADGKSSSKPKAVRSLVTPASDGK